MVMLQREADRMNIIVAPIEAEEMFTKLMGEKVGPRKHFITTEARKVQNLDV